MAAAREFLSRADPVLARLIAATPEPSVFRSDRSPPGEHYAALVRAIVGQQLSTSAARAIWGRLLDSFGGRPPRADEILAAEPDALRAGAGLSRAKVSYLRSLAEAVVSGVLELDRLETLDDERVIGELVQVRGIGEWSAHMFLIFQLGRPDVLARGDLGIRRAVALAYGLPALPSPAAVTQLAEPWRPHRSTACRYLWRSLD